MEEKQLMFEMDSSHRTELEKNLRKYRIYISMDI